MAKTIHLNKPLTDESLLLLAWHFDQLERWLQKRDREVESKWTTHFNPPTPHHPISYIGLIHATYVVYGTAR